MFIASYLPICLTPGIFLNSTITNLGGVKSFNSSNTKITLIGKYKIVNKKMNYYRYFINVDKTKITEDLSFF